MNTDSTISLTFVRDRVKAFYDIMDTKKDAFIERTILDSIDEMQSYKYVSQEPFTLDVCDFKAKLPCNYKTVLAVIPPCGEGCTPIIYSDFKFDGVQGNYQWQQMPNRWKIKNGYLCFPSNFPYDSVDIYCDVFTLGEDGFPILREAHVPYYIPYANYWVGVKLRDSRYKEFVDRKTGDPIYIRRRRNLVHNEQVDEFNYDKVAITAVIKQMGLAGYAYRGNYGYGLNGYGLNGGIL